MKTAIAWHYRATRQHAVLATSIAFYDILARACAEIKILRNFSPFRFSPFLFFSLQ